MTLQVTRARLEPTSETVVRLSAHIGDHELWFDLPASQSGELRGEPFLACLVAPAMARGEAVALDDALPVCPDFLEGVHRYMETVRQWRADLGRELRPVTLHVSCDPPPPTIGVGSFFSGGIDGLYTLVEEQDRLTTAIFTHGIDFQLDSELAAHAASANRSWLDGRGVPLLEMASNARFVGRDLGARWNVHNGACLAGYGHALGLSEIVIASGSAWMDWMGSGSHLLTDPLFSSATTKVTHHGHGPMRWEKLARVVQEAGVVDLLRVCWQDKGYNCGRCEKCRRTMLDLHLLGIQSAAFPPTSRLEDVLPAPIRDWESACYFRHSLVLAERTGQQRAVKLLRSRLVAWERRRWLRDAEAAFFGGRLRHPLRR